MRRLGALIAGCLLAAVMPSLASSAESPLSPSSPNFSYDAGPFTNIDVASQTLILDGCDQPNGCDNHDFTVAIPAGYYEALRSQGKIGLVRISLSWQDNTNDFDLQLLNDRGDPIASSGFGNSDFERINYTELPSGKYTIQVNLFRAINVSFHVDVSLQAATPSPTATQPGTGDVAFSNGTPVTLERSSGEPDMDIAPNGDLFVDMPLGAGTNSILFKSTDNGDTFKPLAPLHPNNNPLTNNVLGGGDAGIAIGPDGRICFTELNTLISLGIGCSSDGGTTFVPSDPLVFDPTTPLVDRQWQAITPQGEVFITAQYGIFDLVVSHPGIRLFKEVAKPTSVFRQIQEIDTGKSMKSYNMAVDPSDTDANGGTIVEAYLRSNQGPDKAANPHELMVWQSTDGGSTVTTHKVADLPSSPGNNFASVDVDRQGNTYVAWSEQGTWDIFYSVAKKGDLDHWSKPVRVNADPVARTAIQPTIKVGDRGRVFLGFYGAPQYGNPDKLPSGTWNAFMAVSTDGACMLDATPCATPTFHQVQITDHPVQYRGVCLGGTACGGDSYYGDRSMLEYLDIAFTPSTGQAHVIVTDSSRENGGTTITMYRQTSGPSAYVDRPAIKGMTRIGSVVADPSGDSGWPYESPVPGSATPGADITRLELSRSQKSLRVAIKVADANGFASALNSALGRELLIGARFSTPDDVLWAGMRYAGGSTTFLGGHLAGGFLVDTYTPDDSLNVTGSVDAATSTITLDVPLDALKTTLQRPAGRPQPLVPAVQQTTAMYSVMGFAFAGVQSIDDLYAKHLLDVTPAFEIRPALVKGKNARRAGAGGGRSALPSTGTGDEGTALMMLAAALFLGRRSRRAS